MNLSNTWLQASGFRLEPSPELLAIARRAAEQCTKSVKLIGSPAERIPPESQSFDTVITTWTLCSIEDAAQGLKEMRRVLKADGQLLGSPQGLCANLG